MNMRASSNRGKTGLFGYLKGLFRTSEPTLAQDSYESSGETDVMVAEPDVNSPVPVADSPAPAPMSGNGHHSVPGVAIPLQSILNGFPAELRSKIRIQAVGELMVSIPLDKVLSQLGQGLVQVPFGDIRSSAPEVFAPGIESDRVPVALPLGEILSRINPALLVRRPAQRQIEVPDEISSPFDARGHGLTLSVGNAQPVIPAAPRKPAPGLTRPVRGSISSITPPVPPTAAATAVPPPAAPIPFSFPRQPDVPAARPQSNIPPARPASSGQFTSAPRSQPQPVAPPSPVAPQPGHSVITTALNLLWESWPDTLRREIVQNNLAEARVALPTNFVEAALRQGRVVFSWQMLRSWIRPALAPGVSVHDTTELELPLRVIAPLFIARKQLAVQTPTKAAVDEAIPNLFFGFPQPEAARPVAEAAVPTEAAPPPASAEPIPLAMAPATPVEIAPKPVDTNYYIWDDVSDTTRIHAEQIKRKGAAGTEFVTRYASPNEIASRAAGLEGVAGALIALPDGLMVASRLPADMNGDTLAAFLPQIFSKVSQCTKELRLGELNNLSFTVGNVPWKIFRVNAIFFAAFGRAAQPLPGAQLAALAVELDRKKK